MPPSISGRISELELRISQTIHLLPEIHIVWTPGHQSSRGGDEAAHVDPHTFTPTTYLPTLPWHRTPLPPLTPYTPLFIPTVKLSLLPWWLQEGTTLRCIPPALSSSAHFTFFFSTSAHFLSWTIATVHLTHNNWESDKLCGHQIIWQVIPCITIYLTEQVAHNIIHNPPK